MASQRRIAAWYNRLVKRSWTRRLLAILVLLTSTLSARSTAAWYCEGRICGTTPWECCCAPDSTSCDLPAELRDVRQEPTSSGCSTDCSCVMVEKALDQNPASRQTITLTVSPVSGLPVVISEEVVCCDRISCESETRGPPLRTRSLLPLGLRAPPAA